MGVPDKTYFGESPHGGGINYGEVRKISDNDEKIAVLRKRLDVLFIKQNRKIAERDEDGQPKIWSPFSLCILTLLGIETLGHVIVDFGKIKSDGDYEQSKKIVTPIYQLFDKKLIDKPTKKFYRAFEIIHGTSDKKSIKRYSDIIHKYQRNTFNHGFQAKGVFLSHTIPFFWVLEEEKGFMIINPFLFWDRLEKVFEIIFDEIENSTNLDWRNNALNYFERLIT
jgi:hypothetical protein